MAYTPTTFNNGLPPAVSAEELNKMGQGIANATALAEANAQRSSGSTTLSGGTFTGRTGSSPNFVYSVKTLTVPLGITAKEVVVSLDGYSLTLYTDAKKCTGGGYNGFDVFKDINKGYGSTVTAPDISALYYGNVTYFGNGAIYLIDAYAEGTTLYLKFTYDNATASITPSQLITVKYVANG